MWLVLLWTGSLADIGLSALLASRRGSSSAAASGLAPVAGIMLCPSGWPAAGSAVARLPDLGAADLTGRRSDGIRHGPHHEHLVRIA